MTGAGVVVVGASVGGARTARALREQGYGGRIRMVDAESTPPYDKPPLSKNGLDVDPFVPLLTPGTAADARIELLLGRRAAELRPSEQRLVLDDGSTLDYEHLVIATGLRARPAPWELEGVHVLRTLDDARQVRARLATARSALVVGAGFIGCEIAALARAADIDVTLVDIAPDPIAHIVGKELSERVADLHRRHGVSTRFGVGVDELVREGDRLQATLSDGTVVEADVVVVGIGSQPNVEWLSGSGLPVLDGVECSSSGRVRGYPTIHAVGDVARWHLPRQGSSARIEHWTNAIEQAACVAHNIANPEATPLTLDPVAYVWSDQYDWRIHLFGVRDEQSAPFIVEENDPFRLAAIWEDGEGRVAGGVTINRSKASVLLRRAVASRASADTLRVSLGARTVTA